MTTVIGYIDKETGIAYIGTDSRASLGSDFREMDEGKASHIDGSKDLLLGVCGRLHASDRLKTSDELRQELVPIDSEGNPTAEPVTAEPKDIDKTWVRKHFIENLKFELEQTILGMTPEDFREMGYGTNVLGIFNGNMFSTDSFATPIFVARNYEAIGSGSPFALGCLEALKNSKMSPEKKIVKALKVAMEFDSATGGACYIISSENLEVKKL